MLISDTLLAGIVSGLTAVAGSAVTGGILFMSANRERMASDRRHRRELAVNAALEDSRRLLEIGKMSGCRVSYMPIETHILYVTALVDAIGDDTVDGSRVDAILDRLHDVARSVDKSTRAFDREQKERDDAD